MVTRETTSSIINKASCFVFTKSGRKLGNIRAFFDFVKKQFTREHHYFASRRVATYVAAFYFITTRVHIYAVAV